MGRALFHSMLQLIIERVKEEKKEKTHRITKRSIKLCVQVYTQNGRQLPSDPLVQSLARVDMQDILRIA